MDTITMRQTESPDSEEILRLLPVGIVAVDRELQVRMANPAAAALLGCTGRDLTGRQVAEVLEEEPFRRLRDGNRDRLSDTVSIPGGEVWLERTFLRDGAGDLMLCVLYDITPLKRREEALLAARRHAADMAETVAAEQLRLVQEVTGLLGEAAAGTQVAVHDLQKAILADGEDEDDRT